MNFRRQPFQFTTIDPAKRHSELQKRFGLPADEMYVDVNPNIMGTGSREPVIGSSPRLQHRVPIFSQGFDQAKPERSQNVDTEHKPRIRTIPIEVEGAGGTMKRHRAFSGPAVSSDGVKHCDLNMPTSPFFGRKVPNACNTNGESPARPKVCNIPIQIETGKGTKKVLRSPEPTTKSERSVPVKTNGCAASKSSAEKTPEPVVEKPPEPDMSVPLKQIENVLTKLKTYHEEVEKFSGTVKDKQYRYLDEMLTRCMLDLDNVETLGLDNVRQSRKAAVRQVQASIDLLDTKVNAQSNTNTVGDSAVLHTSDSNADVEMQETLADKNVQDNSVSAEGDSTMEDSESVSQAMETSDLETVPAEEIKSADQPVSNSVTETAAGDGDSIQTEGIATKTVSESEMENEKPEEASVIVEEVTDTAVSEVEGLDQAENIPVQELVVEMEDSDNQDEAETIKELVVEMEPLGIQIEENNEPEPIVTEPIDSSELTNSTIPKSDLAVVDTEIKDSSNTVVTEISSEDLNNSIDCSPKPVVEETNEAQSVAEKCDSNTSS